MCCEPVLRAAAPFEPSAAATTNHLELDPVPASVSLARSFVRSSLDGVDEATLDVALLLTSELVTNAILHARTPVQLGLLVDDDRSLFCVSDRMPETSALSPRSQSQDRPGGRGLALVADLAELWGTTTFSGGKTVWFLLDAAQDRSLRLG